MTQIKTRASAKINLALHVTGQRGDGYHLLSSLVTFADFGDWVTVAPDVALGLKVEGPFAKALAQDMPHSENIILRAVGVFDPVPKLRITLEKNLPVSSGLGGGSADAAATLHAVMQSMNLAPPADELLLQLGADVPVCFHQKTVIMEGIGEKLSPEIKMPSLPGLLVNPGISVPTAKVFAGLERKDNAALTALPRGNIDTETFLGWLATQRNDLQAPACKAYPVIKEVIDAIADTGARLSRMSGSGATCFGLFLTNQDRDLAAAELSKDYPNWWVQPTRLGLGA